jgi:hypothetical protein
MVGIVAALVTVLLLISASHELIGSFLVWITPSIVAAVVIWRFLLNPRHHNDST